LVPAKVAVQGGNEPVSYPGLATCAHAAVLPASSAIASSDRTRLAPPSALFALPIDSPHVL